MSNTNVELFRERFTDLRAKSGLSIAALSDKTGISETGLRNYESKKENRMPRVPELIEIAKTFNVSADYLLGLSDVPSLDADIQGVCKFTGLSEKAVDSIRNLNDYIYKDLTYEDWLKKAETNPIIKILMDKNPDDYQTNSISYPTQWGVILNAFIESSEFSELIDLLVELQDKSSEDFFLEYDIGKLLDSTVGDDDLRKAVDEKDELLKKKSKLYDKCDLIRLRISREVEKIINMYDKRDGFKGIEGFEMKHL